VEGSSSSSISGAVRSPTWARRGPRTAERIAIGSVSSVVGAVPPRPSRQRWFARGFELLAGAEWVGRDAAGPQLHPRTSTSWAPGR